MRISFAVFIRLLRVISKAFNTIKCLIVNHVLTAQLLNDFI